MPYLRTKDTIYEIVEETNLVYRVKAKGNPNNVYSKSKCQTQGIVGETIEELCDQFVCWTYGKVSVLMDLLQAKLNTKYFDYETVYGAIWTSKGLIYVAKLNDKGELKLL